MKSLLAVAFTLYMTIVPPSHRYGITPDHLPAKLTNAIISESRNTESEINRIYGFRGKNLRHKDFRNVSLELLAEIAYDDGTRWPGRNRLPTGFDPAVWLEAGIAPGLNIRTLSNRGITGKGVAVTIIDKPIDPRHREFTGRITYHEVSVPAEYFQKIRHFHGLACASVLCGERCGVAPGATLHYFSVYDNGQNQANYLTAMKELLDFNDMLPAGQKIQVVSISDNVSSKETEVKWRELMTRAEKADIVVIFSSSEMHSLFTWGGVIPCDDPNDPDDYRYSYWPAHNDQSVSQKVIVPADFRTLAGDDNIKQYAYQGVGGFSYAIPYVAGLVALARSAGCEMTFTELAGIMVATATHTNSGTLVLNPVAFIDEIKRSAG